MTSAISRSVIDHLVHAGLDPERVEHVVLTALAEDVGPGGDVTTEATIPADQRGVALAIARPAGVLAGGPVAAAVFDVVGAGTLTTEVLSPDGSRLAPMQAVLRVEGPLRALLTAERTALNLLGRLSGVATLTRRWVDEVEGTGARIRDTRKTTPGLRALEKYAVRCGGGVNHRMGLWDAALIKDNHVAAAGGVRAAFESVRLRYPDVPLEIEVDSVQQCAEVIEAGAELVLLDNMSTADMVLAVSLAKAAREAGRTVRLEASGGLSLDRAREVAETGVDFLAVGALTHSAPVLDIGLDIVDE